MNKSDMSEIWRTWYICKVFRDFGFVVIVVHSIYIKIMPNKLFFTIGNEKQIYVASAFT